MIIKEMHLDRFGRFQDYSLALGQGLQVIHGANEEGKSTLMAFLQMMFYGSSGRGRDVAGNLRKKYRPWDGSPMKGHLIFEADGTTYRLERVFGQSNVTDQVSLFNETTGERIRVKARKEPGVEYLGLGEDAFARSVFISQGASLIRDGAKQEELTQRLLNLVTTGSEEVSYQSALDSMNQARERLVSKNQKNGLLVLARQEVEHLEERRRAAQAEELEKLAAQEELEREQNCRRELIERKAVLDREQKKNEGILRTHQLAAAIDRETRHLELTRQMNALEARLTYSGGRMDRSYLSAADEMLRRIHQNEAKTQSLEENLSARETELEALDSDRTSPLEEPLEELKANEVRQSELEEQLQVTRRQLQELRLYRTAIQKAELLSGQCEETSAEVREAEVELTQLEEQYKVVRVELEEAKQAKEQQRQTQWQKEQEIRQLEEAMARSRLQVGQWQADLSHNAGQISKETPSGSYSNRSRALPALTLSGLAVLLALILGSQVHPGFYGVLILALLFAAWGYRGLPGAADSRGEAGPDEADQLRAMLLNQIDQLEKEQAGSLVQHTALTREVGELTQGYNRSIQRLAEMEARYGATETQLDEVRRRVLGLTSRLSALTREHEELQRELEQFTVKGTKLDELNLLEELDQMQQTGQCLEKRHAELLDLLEARDLTDAIQKVLTSQMSLQRAQQLGREISKLRQELEQLAAQRTEHINDLLTHLQPYRTVKTLEETTGLMQDLTEDLERCQQLSIQREAGEQNRQELEKNHTLEELKLLWSESSADERDAALPDPDDLRDLEHQAEMLTGQIHALDRTLAAREAELREKYRSRENLSQVEERLDQARMSVKGKQEQYEILTLAQTKLTEAFEELQQSFGPLLNDRTGAILRRLTRDKYQNVRVSRSFDIMVEDGNQRQLFEWGYLSGGTVDQAYLALRLAITDLISSPAQPLPLFLDDIFTQYDDARAREGLNFLKEHTCARPVPLQTVLFTCHGRIRDWASLMPEVTVLDLT